MDSAPSVGDQIAYTTVGILITGIYGLLYNQFNNLAVFKPKSNLTNYQKQVHDMSQYAIYNQNSPQYDIELLRKESSAL
ncbi:hypothetical protein [Arcticibacter eurypsychrophilus]|uniref:hypothetical protein n=1 Tax=Arcticibacter eurypsychrophilus TaxID=1434752 RepID=UPI00084DB4F5|nr:hypothetical protein [Arcticibacter eurypsychrophilus]